MHELALSQSIVELVCELSARDGLRNVTRVVLEVGEMAGVEVDALKFCFDASTRNTAAQGSELAIARVPARGCCRSCTREFALPSPVAPCPHCGEYGARVVAGRELRVREFEGI